MAGKTFGKTSKAVRIRAGGCADLPVSRGWTGAEWGHFAEARQRAAWTGARQAGEGDIPEIQGFGSRSASKDGAQCFEACQGVVTCFDMLRERALRDA